jgi:hypothetical protein
MVFQIRRQLANLYHISGQNKNANVYHNISGQREYDSSDGKF